MKIRTIALTTYVLAFTVCYGIADFESTEEFTSHPVTTAAPPKPCCFPSVWQGYVTSDYGYSPIGRADQEHRSRDGDDITGEEDIKTKGGANCGRQPFVSRAVSKVFIDGVNKRAAGQIFRILSKPAEPCKNWTNTSYIFTVGSQGSSDLYVFDRKAQTCRHRIYRNVQWTNQCIPASSLYAGQLTLGPAAGGLTVDSWLFEGCSKRADALVAAVDCNVTSNSCPKLRTYVGGNLLVLPGSCVPVTIQEEGKVTYRAQQDSNEIRLKTLLRPRANKWRGITFVGSAIYSGLQTTIADPSVFTVPGYCNRQSNTLHYEEMDDELPPGLERFVSV